MGQTETLINELLERQVLLSTAIAEHCQSDVIADARILLRHAYKKLTDHIDAELEYAYSIS